MTDPRDPTAAYGIDLPRSERGTKSLPQDTGFFAGIGIGYDQGQTGPDTGMNAKRYRDTVFHELAQTLHDKGYGDFYMSAVRGDGGRYDDTPDSMAAWQRKFWSAVRRARQAGDIKGYDDVWDNASLDARALRQQQGDIVKVGRASARLTTMGKIGAFLGNVGASYDDPETWATAAIPVGAVGGGVTRQILLTGMKEGAVNAAAAVAVEPLVRRSARRLGIERTWQDTAYDVGAQFGFGQILGSAGKGASLWLDRAVAAGTADDRALVEQFRAKVPEENWTPDEWAAVHVTERTAEIAEASPFEAGPAGVQAHAAALENALKAVVDAVEEPAHPTIDAVASSVPQARPPRHVQWAAIISNEGGTNTDGSFRTSSAGAIGPAQVMPATGPEAARLAGVAWDEARFHRDHAYNEQLGRAYFEEQLRVFGDPAKAAAAYNAGPGSARTGKGLRGAMARAARAGEPENWEKYLPSETRDYVRKFREKTGMGDGPDGMPQIADDIATPEWSNAPPEPVFPQLRREQFADDATWRITQAEVEGEHLGFTPELSHAELAQADPITRDVRIGDFGPVHEDVNPADWAAVLGRLREAQTGEVIGALNHPATGPIDVVWGHANTPGRHDGMGLAKIIADHPEVDVNALPELIGSMNVAERLPDRIRLETPDHFAAVRLDWNGETKHWLVTAFQKRDSQQAARMEGEASAPADFGRAGTGGRDGSPGIDARTDIAGQASKSNEAGPLAAVAPSPDTLAIGQAQQLALRFDDPAGAGAIEQAAGLSHDVQAAIESGALGDVVFAASGIALRDGTAAPMVQSAKAILADLDAEDAAIAAMRGCL